MAFCESLKHVFSYFLLMRMPYHNVRFVQRIYENIFGLRHKQIFENGSRREPVIKILVRATNRFLKKVRGANLWKYFWFAPLTEIWKWFAARTCENIFSSRREPRFAHGSRREPRFAHFSNVRKLYYTFLKDWDLPDFLFDPKS